MTFRVIVIGGGITGLTAAFSLKQAADREGVPISCTVLEGSSRFGGKILTRREDGFVMEGGPDSLLARKPEGMQLIRELGLESELVGGNPKAQKTYVLYKGKLEHLPPGTNMGIPTTIRPFATTRLLSVSGKARALLDLVLPRKQGQGDESLGKFLRRRLGDELVNNVAEPLLAGIYAGSVDDLSLQATFPQFQTLEAKHRSLILGSMAQRRQAPKTSPSSGRSIFVTLRGGLMTLVERLFDSLQDWADLRTSTRVVQLDKSSNGTSYDVTVESADGTETIEADAVIVTTPAFVSAKLLHHLTPQSERLQQIPYVSTATVMLAYPADFVNVELDASGFVVPRSENRSITACTWVSSKWPHTTPEGYVLIRCYVGRSGQVEGLDQSDEAIIDDVKRELKDILGITAQPWFADVTRWDHAMPQYAIHHLKLVREVEAALHTVAPLVRIAGAGYLGLGIPDCIAQGRGAVREVLEEWKQANPSTGLKR